MENNEQLNQNPETVERIENEKVTQKSVKKAIDAVEKKKIIKLIQPSILPSKVRIDVHTLVEANAAPEPTPMPQDEALPDIDMSAEAELEEEEAVEESNELEGLNKLQLVELLEEAVQNLDVQAIKDKVAAIRIHFNKLNKDDLDNELQQFLQGGGSEESFQHNEGHLQGQSCQDERGHGEAEGGQPCKEAGHP